jgi:hypothetical protein
VKQGGILSPYLFNYYLMNELLINNDNDKLGAYIGNLNVGLLSNGDDLIILSPYVSHVNQILKHCEDYGNWYLHENSLIINPNFTLNQRELSKVNDLIR